MTTPIQKAMHFFKTGETTGQKQTEYPKLTLGGIHDHVNLLRTCKNIVAVEMLLHWMEISHDYIQWFFPITRLSKFNQNSPDGITTADVSGMHPDDLKFAQERLQVQFQLMLYFYGLTYENGQVQERKGNSLTSFKNRKANWLGPNNHNHLRLTRIVQSLELFGVTTESRALFIYLHNKLQHCPDEFSPETTEFWNTMAQERKINGKSLFAQLLPTQHTANPGFNQAPLSNYIKFGAPAVTAVIVGTCVSLTLAFGFHFALKPTLAHTGTSVVGVLILALLIYKATQHQHTPTQKAVRLSQSHIALERVKAASASMSTLTPPPSGHASGIF